MAEEASSVSRIMAQVMTTLQVSGSRGLGSTISRSWWFFFFRVRGGGRGGVRFFAFRVPTVYSPGWRIHGFWRTMIIT